jgi:preprotein translocase subunit SecE
MNPWTAAFIVLGIIALVGLFIILFDKGLKRRG